MDSFLYLQANIGPAAVTPESNDRFLYLQKNVTNGVPQPWIRVMSPAAPVAGTELTVFGQGFDNADRDWNAEVRLYEEPSFDSAYVVLPEVSFTAGDAEDVFVVDVPEETVSGWVAVVNSSGSRRGVTTGAIDTRLRNLPVWEEEAHPDVDWYVEVWDRENTQRQIVGFTVIDAFFKKIMNAVGNGYITIPINEPMLDEIISVANKETSLIKVFLGGRFQYAFFADDVTTSYAEEGLADSVRIGGSGMEAIAARHIIGNHDYPAVPSRTPTWVYGSTENFVTNPEFEDISRSQIRNPGGEEGNDQDGFVEGWSAQGEVTTAKAVRDSSKSREDEWYIHVYADELHAGITQSIPCERGKRYHVRCYVKEPKGVGMRVTLGVSGANDIKKSGAYPNNYVWNNGVYAELDNVPRNPAANGHPGGKSNGKWQVLDVGVTTGKDQTSLEIKIIDDHHGSGGKHVPFWVDSVSIEGWGVGVAPWEAYRPDRHNASSMILSSVHRLGEHSIILDVDTRYGGLQSHLSLNPSTKYTFTAYLIDYAPKAGDSWDMLVRMNDGVNTPNGIGTLIAQTPWVYPVKGKWTKLEVTGTTPNVDNVDAIIRLAYTGTNNPGRVRVDSVYAIPGDPPSKAGKIVRDAVRAIHDRGEMSELQVTFTDTRDSKGEKWAKDLSLDIEPSETLKGVLDRIVALGYEWDIVPYRFDSGRHTGFRLNLYIARPFNRFTGVGVNYAEQKYPPRIMPSDATTDGRVAGSLNLPNRVHVAGDNGLWTVAYQENFSEYSGTIGVISEYLTAPSGVDKATLVEYANQRLSELRDMENAVQLGMQWSNTLRPFVEFGVGTSIQVSMPPFFDSADFQRVRAISASLDGEGADSDFTVDISRVLYEDEARYFAKVAQLAERTPTDFSTEGGGSAASASGTAATSPGGWGSSGFDTGDFASKSHKHRLDGREITHKTTSGDVNGELPGPLAVTRIKGVPVDIQVPVGDKTVGMFYDRDNRVFYVDEFSDVLDESIMPLVEERMRWRGTWEQGVYEKSDVVNDGAWTLVATESTTVRPLPVPKTVMRWATDDVAGWEVIDVPMSVRAGVRVTPGVGELVSISGFRAWIEDTGDDIHYWLMSVDNLTGATTTLVEFNGSDIVIPGWVTLGLSALIPSGEDRTYFLVFNSWKNTTVDVASWHYAGTSDLDNDPGLGNIETSEAGTTLRVSATDTDGTDSNSILAGMAVPGSVFRLENQGSTLRWVEYRVVSGTNEGGWWRYAVVLLGDGSPLYEERTVVTATSAEQGATTRVEVMDEFIDQPVIHGVLQLGDGPEVKTNTAYGMDALYRVSHQPHDWDVLSYSGGSSGGASGGTPESALPLLESWPTGPLRVSDDPYTIVGSDLTVAAGHGVIMDSHTSPELEPAAVSINWDEQTLHFGNVTERHASYVYIDRDGELHYAEEAPDGALFRNRLYLGRVFHSITTGALADEFRPWHPVPGQAAHTVYDFIAAVGGSFLIEGSGIDPIQGTMSFATPEQKWFSPGESWRLNRADPNFVSHPGSGPETPQVFSYMDRLGEVYDGNATEVSASLWESAPGVISPIGGNPNTTTIQRLYTFVDGQYVMAPGQALYADMEEALNKITLDIHNYKPSPYIENESQIHLVAYILVENGATDLADGTDVVIVDDGRIPMGGGGTSVHTHDSRYLKLSGGVMAGNIEMDDYDVRGLPDEAPWPSSAVSRHHLDTRLGYYLPLDGGSMTGALRMVGSAQIRAAIGTTAAPGIAGDAAPDSGIKIGTDMVFVMDGKQVIHVQKTRTLFADVGYDGSPIIKHDVGTVSAPSFSFIGDTSTGVFWVSSGTLGMSSLGAERFRMNRNGVYLTAHGTTGSAANTFVNSTTGLLARSTSARRYKSNIQPAAHLADLELTPVTFHHDGDDKDYVGFIADDVSAQLAIAGEYDDDGKIESYDLRAVVAILAAKVNRLEAT